MIPSFLMHFMFAQFGRSFCPMGIIILMREKFCLDSIVPFQTLNQSPTNRSISKQTFSFARSPRFEAPAPNCPMSTYAGERILRKNSGAGIGYGKKSDFTKSLASSPDSSHYNLKAVFDINKEKRKGCTIGTSRERVLFDSYIDQGKLKNPGIARYNIETESSVRAGRAPSYSMRDRTRVHDKTRTIEPQNANPGPADYENNPEMSKTLYSSHFSRIGYSNSKSKRFLNPDNRVPGPGDYDNSTSLSNVGKYVMSTHRGGTYAKFDSSPRRTKFDEIARAALTRPGPGQYKAPSQFGVYDGDVYGLPGLNATVRHNK